MTIISDYRWYLYLLCFFIGMMFLLLQTKSLWFIAGMCLVISSLQQLHNIEAHER